MGCDSDHKRVHFGSVELWAHVEGHRFSFTTISVPLLKVNLLQRYKWLNWTTQRYWFETDNIKARYLHVKSRCIQSQTCIMNFFCMMKTPNWIIKPGRKLFIVSKNEKEQISILSPHRNVGLLSSVLWHLRYSPNLCSLSHIFATWFKRPPVLFGYAEGMVAQERFCCNTFLILWARVIKLKDSTISFLITLHHPVLSGWCNTSNIFII